MSVFVVPPQEEEPWPTLGGQVCAWIEENLVFGPGDLRGEPARLDAEKRALIWRMYEVYPQGHPQAGRRRFRRCAVSLRKGSAKTELLAWIAAAELHPEAPVRTRGWDGHGNPIGGGVTDPYIPLVAYTEEQSEELAYGALRVILAYSRVREDFDIGIERIMRIGGDGKAVALSTAPDARDGARTTFSGCDETHRWTLPRLRMAHRVMLANLPKRRLADPWSLEITTAPAPGEGSVAEATMEYARQVEEGKETDTRLFFFHRQAGGDGPVDLSTPEAIRSAVIEASGPIAEWSDIDGIVEQWDDPTADRAYLERVWLNRLVRSSDRAFDAERWRELAVPDYVVPDGAKITVGFDGARSEDSTALIGTEIKTGYQWVLGLWEKPYNIQEWEVSAEEVEAVLDQAMNRWDVVRMYADPPYWESYVAHWAGQYGEERVWKWYTTRTRAMAFAILSFHNAIQVGELQHSGDPNLQRHIGNACRRTVTLRDEQGRQMWTIYKERSDSPHKIDAAMAAILSWEARRDAIAAGALAADGPSIYETRGVLRV